MDPIQKKSDGGKPSRKKSGSKHGGDELTSLTTGYFESFDGTKIYFESRGAGEPLVFVYGIACIMNHLHHQIDHLAKHYRVITFDLRGHAKSELPISIDNMSIHAICEDISALLRNLSIRQAHFVGHSFGVPVLLQSYHQSPDFYKSLVFINGFAKNPIKKMFGLDFAESGFYWLKKAYAKNPILVGALWKSAIDNPVSAWMSGLLGGFNLKSVQFKDIEIYAKAVSQISLDGFLALFEQMMNFNGLEMAKEIKVPTLLLSGDADFLTPPAMQLELSQAIKNSVLIEVPNGSHCCQLDFPELVNNHIETFLKSVTQKSPEASQ